MDLLITLSESSDAEHAILSKEQTSKLIDFVNQVINRKPEADVLILFRNITLRAVSLPERDILFPGTKLRCDCCFFQPKTLMGFKCGSEISCKSLERKDGQDCIFLPVKEIKKMPKNIPSDLSVVSEYEFSYSGEKYIFNKHVCYCCECCFDNKGNCTKPKKSPSCFAANRTDRVSGIWEKA